MIRPRDPGSATSTRCAVGIIGHSFDPAELQLDVPEKVEEFIRENTGRTQLKFRNWTWLSKFRFTDFLHLCILLLLIPGTFHRPKMRMVNTFQSGRAFCVGGMFFGSVPYFLCLALFSQIPHTYILRLADRV